MVGICDSGRLIMNTILRYYFFISLVIGSVIYIAQKQNIVLPYIINNYVNDFLIVPICLTLSLIVLRYTKNNKHYYLKIYHAIYLALIYAVLFEIILPRIYERYTADIIDATLYLFSAIIFYTLQEKKVTILNSPQ